MRQLCFLLKGLLFAGAVLLVGGCTGFLPSRMPLHQQVSPLPPGPVCRVAILPFLNDSDYPYGNEIVQKVFATRFQGAGDHRVIQDGDVLKIYHQLRIIPGEPPTPEQLRIIGDRVDAQLMITGIILEMREDPGAHRTANPMIIMEVQILDGESGETLWTTFHRRRGTDYKKAMHFGTLHTVTGLSQQMAGEIINLWYERGLSQCTVLP